MPRSLLNVALLLPLALVGCANPKYGVFATSTNLGIDADATAGKVVIGYDRTEGFVGPGYPKTGTAPSVFGFIESDQNVFNPKVRQLYATGSAADLVTQTEQPKTPDLEKSTGKSQMMVFGTTTSIALRIGYGPAAPLPDSISLGYKRREASLIPVEPGDDETEAKYAPTLASIDMNTTTSKGLPEAKIGVRQFFATGHAARNLAADKVIRDIYRGEAASAVAAGQHDALLEKEARKRFVGCVSRSDEAFTTTETTRLTNILAQAEKDKKISPAQKARLEKAKDRVELQDTVAKILSGNAKDLDGIVQSNPQLCV